MTQPDIDWTLQLFEHLKQDDTNVLERWLGVISAVEITNEKDKTCILIPVNSRLKRIVLNYENDKLDRLVLEGDTFALPFLFLLSLTEAYKRTCNTYDAIDDEQFMFYPGKKGIPIVAIEGWISPECQTGHHASIHFSTVYFHLNDIKVPCHFRTGWHMIIPPK